MACFRSLSLLMLPLAGALLFGARRPPPLVGRVSDDAGPVAGARVRYKATAFATRSGSDGSFRLPRRGGRLTAAKDGYFIAGAAADDPTFALRRLPTEDDEAYQWVDPAPDPNGRHNCANCHAEIFREWSFSAHSRSAKGRHFLGLYDDLVRERPDGAGVCNACHVPTMPPGEGTFDARAARGVAARGVHCDYCHKIQDVGAGPPGLAHGRFNLTLLRPAEGQLFFGPLDDVDRGDDAFSPLYRDSRYCASCHEGVVFGVPVYTTYSEWVRSPAGRAGRQCQTCHMVPTGRMTNAAPGRGGVARDPKTLANHRFFAGSQEEMLRGAVTLTARATRGDAAVRVEVEVRADGVGHRLPTGFIDRNLVLLVDAVDAAGRPLAALGGPTHDGKAGKLYAKVANDFDGRGPVPFWRADPAVSDTRLDPGRPDRSAYAFPAATASARARLIYRRFWPETARAKGWPDDAITIADIITMTGGAAK